MVPSTLSEQPWGGCVTQWTMKPVTTEPVEPPGPSACIDFTDLVVDDSVALEGDEAFTILVGDSMAMVNIIDDDGEQLGLNIESVTKNSNLLIVKF